MDNFREWLSDNLRYFMLGGVILIIVAVLFFSIRACTGSGKGTSDGEQTTAQDNSQGNDPSSPEDDGETNDGKKEEDTNPLEDGSEEVTALMNSYYKALGEKDITTLRTLVNNLTPSDESRITNAKDYIEGYQVSKVYMKKGMDDNSYVVYTKGSFICKGIDTPAPSLWSSYVVKDSDGTYRILGDLEQNTTVSTYMDSLKSDEDVKKLTAEVQAEYEQAQKDEKLKGMGTTMVVSTIVGQYAYVANVGDSRLYVADRELQQITRDHSLVQEMVRMGEISAEEARNHPDKNIITRALGAERTVDVDFFDLKLEPESVILMCSDGLSNMVEDSRIKEILSRRDEALDERGRTLIGEANRNGGKDNIAIVLIEPFANEVEEC